MTEHSPERKGPGRQAASAEAIIAADRHARWMRFRIAGKTYQQIADLEGVAKSTVQEACVRRLRAVTAEPAEALIVLELERLDALLDAVWARATEGEEELRRLSEQKADPKVIELVYENQLKFHEQARKVLADRRKMLGLEAPKKLELTGPSLQGDALEAARAALATPIGQVRELLLEALRAPSKEWEMILAASGYVRRGVLTTHGEDLTTQGEYRSQFERAASIATLMIEESGEKDAGSE